MGYRLAHYKQRGRIPGGKSQELKESGVLLLVGDWDSLSDSLKTAGVVELAQWLKADSFGVSLHDLVTG